MRLRFLECCLYKKGCLGPVSPVRLAFGGLAYIREAVRGQCRRRDWDFGALPIQKRLFEASLAGGTGILGPCLYKRGCMRPIAPAKMGFWGLAYVTEAL